MIELREPTGEERQMKIGEEEEKLSAEVQAAIEEFERQLRLDTEKGEDLDD